MSYDQTFKGRFRYVDAHCMEAAVDAFVASDVASVSLGDLAFDGLTISIDYECSAPASSYEDSLSALTSLGAYAMSGAVEASFELDGVSYYDIGHGNRTASDGLPPRHGRWDVFRAARAGSVDELRALAAAGVSLAQLYPMYRRLSSLHLAAGSGSGPAVQLLLDAGIPADIASSATATTPLAWAASAEVVRLLLLAGADRDRQVGNATVLVAASRRGHDAAVIALLEAGATIPAACRGELVRHCAERGAVATLRALLQRDPSIASALREPAVIAAAIDRGHAAFVDHLLELGATLPALSSGA
jgi:hypothetical protein